METLILGSHEVQAHAIAAAVRVPVHIEFARGLVALAIVIMVMIALLDLMMPEKGPRR